MAEEISVTEARAELAELVNRVSYGGSRVVLTRHGKPLAAIVSAADLELLERLAPESQTRVVVPMPVTQTRVIEATERRSGIAASDDPQRGRRG
ncbi:MAG TPA: type II toxin-antitoxin system Phd/YefM family antitoxin [Micromonosporaceae bacterium]|jgi:prevent-host-death family protein